GRAGGRARRGAGGGGAIWVRVPGSRQLPATVRVTCQPTAENQACAVGNVNIVNGSTLTLPGGFLFVVDAIRADAPPAPVVATIQFMGRAAVIDLIASGDVEASGRPDGARVLAVRSRGALPGPLARQIPPANL